MLIALLLAGGLAALVAGAQLLIRGASALALSVGISPLVTGLTVVAFGTSAPELAVSIQGAWSGQADIAIGNVVGSNIFNVLFILGLSALVVPLVVSRQVVRQEVPIMIGASLLLFLCALDGEVSRPEGLGLAGLLVAYTVFLIWQARRENRTQEQGGGSSLQPPAGGVALQLGLVAAGLILLVLGSRSFVTGAVTLATQLGVSELVIGLTIIAAGTSLPEVATSVLAAIKGERDIAVGNVVGSNTFNVLGVLGASATVAPEPLAVAPSVLSFDAPAMIAVAVACLPIFLTGGTIARWEGGVFLGYYAAYTAFLILGAQQHDLLTTYSFVMAWVVIPLTALTFAVLLGLELRARRR